MKFNWKIQREEIDDIVEALLENRGIKETDVAAFLNPSWNEHTHDPAEFMQIKQAVDKLFEILKQGKSIIIHGDYDADGVSGAALLYTVIHDIAEKLNITPNVQVFLPDRERDGYGVAMHTIERFGKESLDLLITVDCGIANADQLDYAHELGIDVIVCDHHQLGERLSQHALIIHPLAPGETYPNKHLCGTGVAFKFASALIEEARKRGADFSIGFEKWYLDFVAIATVTDVMPLTGENRVLEKYGLIVLNKTRRPGIRKIVELSRSKIGMLDTQSIGFRIGPRINAAGRIGSAKIAFETIASKDSQEVERLANELELLNRERQRISEAAFRQAKQIVKERPKAPIHVVWHDAWHPGIVGLIAGKLVTEFGVPAFALTRVGNQFVGSGRSIGGLHLVEAMRSCGDIFVKAGGHPQACGLTLENEDLLHKFQCCIETYARDFFGDRHPQPELYIDGILPLEKINWDTERLIRSLAPFGEGNPRPVFVARNVQIVRADAVGKMKSHLKLFINPPEGENWNAIAFGFGDMARRLMIGDLVDIAYEININEWNGNHELQLRVLDLNLAEDNDILE